MHILITGGCGFIASNFVHYLLERYDYRIINLDALTYAGNPENLREFETNPRYKFIHGRIEDVKAVKKALRGVDRIVHFAAESHVDRSITNAQPFIQTNVAGTQVLLDACRQAKIDRFIHVSTDEVYGSLGDKDRFTETTPLAPNSPYAASKAASDLLVRATAKTHGLPAIITRCSNNYGPYQFPEKLIPLMITNALEDKPLPVYGDGLNVRDWIHVTDHCAALDTVLHRGIVGETYNIGGESERKNIDVVKTILRLLKKSESLITFVDDRPGHDRRYAMDIKKIKRQLKWSPAVTFEKGLELTIDWYRRNEKWWRRVKSGRYRQYYRKMYGQRLAEGKKP
ncbi:MAG: dTDP-glucose 4,6-dehydratase [Thermodesulfobacteriota bacterium]|nr:dTDP-glucose 4,6-dehydratase [Thermodesulfobacteriota bacterium]